MTYIKQTANRIASRYRSRHIGGERVIGRHQNRMSELTYNLDMAAVHRNAMR